MTPTRTGERLARIEERQEQHAVLLTEVRTDVKTLLGNRAWSRGVWWGVAKVTAMVGALLGMGAVAGRIASIIGTLE